MNPMIIFILSLASIILLHKVVFAALNHFTKGTQKYNDPWVGEVIIHIKQNQETRLHCRKFYKSKKMAEFSMKYLVWKLKAEKKIGSGLSVSFSIQESQSILQEDMLYNV